jgi:hypothetical protein
MGANRAPLTLRKELCFINHTLTSGSGAMLSAASDGAYDGSQSCSPNIEMMQGTSMACPAVAGAATLARQYFMDGFYPTGMVAW